MTDPAMTEALLAESAWLRGLIRTLVRDDAADDVVQDTLLATWQSRVRIEVGMRAWLARVARTFVARVHRQDARRRRREAIAALPEAVPATDELVMRLQVQQRVAAAVEALPEPYRRTVLLRWFEDRPPRAIAASMGVPVETVRTRLKRALAMLRQRLDAQHGGRAAWALPFGTGVACGGQAAAVGVGPALLAGSMVMASKAKVALVASAAIAALVVAWAVLTPDSPSHVGEASGDVAAVMARPRDGAGEVPPAAARTPVEVAVAAPMTPIEAVIRGRCVDESGAPRARVRVTFSGGASNDQRMQAHVRDHGPIEWRELVPITTGADGLFVFRFVPPPPYAFSLHVEAAGAVPLLGQWDAIAPGATLELGDLVLCAGVRVHGRVVDTGGLPRADVRVSLDRLNVQGGERGEIRRRDFHEARSAADGTFSFRAPLFAAAWKLWVMNARRVSPGDLVEISGPETRLDIVVATPADEEAITGVVVDDRGAPVFGAEVYAGMRHTDPRASTDHAGQFRVLEPRSQVSGVRFRMRVVAADHEVLETEPVHAFGEEDVRLVLQRGLPLDVAVRRESDGAAVEEFGVRLLPKPGSRAGVSSHDVAVRGGWQHANGIAHLAGIRRGPYLLCVEPTTASGLAAAHFVAVTIADGAPQAVEVRLRDRCTRRVEVTLGDDEPSVGSTVELLQPRDGESVTAMTRALHVEEWASSRDGALLLMQDPTGADGSCELHGPPDRELVVRVRGDAHAMVVVTGVRFDAPSPLRVDVPAGGTLRGRIGPPEVLQDLRELAGLPRSGASGERVAPAILLQRTRGEDHETHPPGVVARGVPVAQDGTFAVRGVPPGTWDVCLLSYRSLGFGHGGQSHVVGTVTLRDGETQELEADVGALRCGRLRGTMLVDGRPFVGQVQLAPAGGRWSDDRTVSAMTGPGGVFDVMLAGGAWMARPFVSAPPQVYVLKAPEVVTVVPDQCVETTFSARTARAKVRLLAPDGMPAVGALLFVMQEDSPFPFPCPPADAEGCTEVVASPGDWQLRARVRSLCDEKAWQSWLHESGGMPAANAATQVPVGSITLPAADGTVELRLPSAWDR